MLDKLKETCLFSNNSPKRKTLLINVMSTDEPHAHRKKPILNLCLTRWVERQDAYLHFHQAYPHIVHSLEVIVHNMHHGHLCTDWQVLRYPVASCR